MRRPLHVLVAASLLAVSAALAGCGSARVSDSRPAPQAPPDAGRQWDTQRLPPYQPGGAQPPAGADATPLAPGPSAGPAAKTTVALLLPLTGQHAAIGQAMLNAAQLAVFDVGGENFVLVPKDTRGTPEGASRAASDAVADGASLIVGPLLAAEVSAAATAVRGAVPILAFSNDRSVAGNGVYLMGFLPSAEVRRVVGYAKEQGLRRFGVLAPENAYGRLVVAAMEQAAAGQGGTISRSAWLRPGATMEEVTQVARQLAEEPGRVRLEPAPADAKPFDALMLPLGGQQLALTASVLQAGGIDPGRVRYLGTGLWDRAGIGREPALVGGWFAAPPPEARAAFERRYAEAYDAEPPRLATLAYDATTLAAALASGPGGIDRSRLADPKGFYGADGLFRFRPDGTAERGFAVLQVTRDGPTVLDPAPARFDEAIF